MAVDLWVAGSEVHPAILRDAAAGCCLARARLMRARHGRGRLRDADLVAYPFLSRMVHAEQVGLLGTALLLAPVTTVLRSLAQVEPAGVPPDQDCPDETGSFDTSSKSDLTSVPFIGTNYRSLVKRRCA